jgi:hypothetical protein
MAQVPPGPPAAAPAAPGNAPPPEAAPGTFAPFGPGQTLRLTGLSFNGSVDLSETYTTNAFGVGSGFGGGSGPDFITTLGLSLGAHDHTVRFDGDLSSRVAADLYARHSASDHVYLYLDAVGNAILVQNYLVLRASAFAAPILANNLGPLGAGGRPVAGGAYTGTRDTYGYTVSPDLTFRLGDFANLDTVPRQSSIFFVPPNTPTVNQPVPGQTIPDAVYLYGASEIISSGTDFNRLNWTFTGSYDVTSERLLEYREAIGLADLKYAISRELSLLGNFGYESLTSNQPLLKSLVGPVAMGGLRVTFTNAFEADATAGWRYNSNSYTGNLRYAVGPYTTILGSYTDSVNTPAGLLSGGFGQIGVNGQGGFVNTGYQPPGGGLPPSVPGVTTPNPVPVGGLGFNTAILRYKAATASVLYIADRTDLRLTAYRTSYDTLTVLSGALPQTTSTGFEFAANRRLTPRLSATATVNYLMQDVLGGRYDLLNGSIDVDYTISPVMTAFFRAAYVHRLSNAALVAASPITTNESDATVTIGIARQF